MTSRLGRHAFFGGGGDAVGQNLDGERKKGASGGFTRNGAKGTACEAMRVS